MLPDIDDLDTYGGELEDYAPAEDPTTDRSADAANQAFGSAAAATQVIPRAWARLVTHATTPTLATSNNCDGTWPNVADNRPTPSRSATGVFVLTWPTTVLDSLGDSHTLNFRWARACVEGSTYVPVQCTVTSANVVTVYTFNTSFAANDQAGKTVLVEVG